MAKMNLEEFKELVSNDEEFKNNLSGNSDLVCDGALKISSKNLNLYLEKYACKDAQDLEDTLYYCYGIYCKVI